MGVKANYILFKLEILDNLKEQLRLCEEFKSRTFSLLDKPEKQRCLWIKFDDTEEIWRSQTSIINIEEIPEGLIVKTRGEIYHIHKCKQS